MSLESSPKSPINRSEDIRAAAELIAENEILSQHPRVLELLNNDFVLPDGREVDAGYWLADMLKVLDDEAVSPEQLNEQIEKALVVHARGTH